MDERFSEIEERLSLIEERNARVEKDKAWETSLTRIVTVSILTYFVAVLAFWMLGNEQFWLSAFIPTLGFLLSVQSVPVVKKWWLK